MRKILFLVTIAIIGQGCATKVKGMEEKKPSEEEIEVSTTVDRDNSPIASHMRLLASDELQGREAGSPGIERAAAYIEDVFRQNNVKPYFSTFKDTLSNFREPAFNVVGYVEGNDAVLKKEFVIVGAHYDHIGSAKSVNGDTVANGANDNASGTTAVLEFAKYFGSSKTNKRSILFVLFSAEEKGLKGSKHLAKKLKAENFNLYTMINFEMIGVPMNDKDYLAYITGYQKSNMAAKFNEYAGGEKVIGFLPTAKSYNLFERSDNLPFHKQFKVPSQTVCTFDFTNFDYYHHVDDENTEMDFEHMANVIAKMIPILEKTTNSSTKEISYK